MNDRLVRTSLAASLASSLLLAGAMSSVLAQDANTSNGVQLRGYQGDSSPAPATTAPVPTGGKTDIPPVPTLGAPIPSAALPVPKAKVTPVQKASVVPAPVAPSKKAAADAPAPVPAKDAKHRSWWRSINPLAKSDEDGKKENSSSPNKTAAATAGVKSSTAASKSAAGASASAPGTTAKSAAPAAGAAVKTGAATTGTATTGTATATGAHTATGAVPPRVTAAARPKPALPPKPPADLSTFIKQVDTQSKQYKKPQSARSQPQQDDANEPESESASSELKPPNIYKKGGSGTTARKRPAPSADFDLEADVPVMDDGKGSGSSKSSGQSARAERSGHNDEASEKTSERSSDRWSGSASRAKRSAFASTDGREPRDETVDPRTLDPMPHYRKSLMYTKSGDYKSALKEVNRALL